MQNKNTVMTLSEKDQEIYKKYVPKSTKVLIRFIEGKQNKIVNNIINPEEKKVIYVDDYPKYYKEHPYIGYVLGIGSKIEQEEQNVLIGSTVLLKGIPNVYDACLINGEVLYSVDIAHVLCIQRM